MLSSTPSSASSIRASASRAKRSPRAATQASTALVSILCAASRTLAKVMRRDADILAELTAKPRPCVASSTPASAMRSGPTSWYSWTQATCSPPTSTERTSSHCVGAVRDMTPEETRGRPSPQTNSECVNTRRPSAENSAVSQPSHPSTLLGRCSPFATMMSLVVTSPATTVNSSTPSSAGRTHRSPDSAASPVGSQQPRKAIQR